MENEKRKPCLSCKIISVCCLCGIGGYLLNTSKMYRNTSRVSLIILGIGTTCLGIGEIFDMSPFRK